LRGCVGGGNLSARCGLGSDAVEFALDTIGLALYNFGAEPEVLGQQKAHAGHDSWWAS